MEAQSAFLLNGTVRPDLKHIRPPSDTEVASSEESDSVLGSVDDVDVASFGFSFGISR